MLAFLKTQPLKYALIFPSIVAAAYITFVFAANRLIPHQPEIETLAENGPPPLSDDRLTIETWNIGYGGLGAESDFISDGGEQVFPPSRKVVDKNISGIESQLEKSTADIIIMQETAGSSLLTRGANPLSAINETLANRDNAFTPDFWIRYLPWPISPRHGLFSSAGVSVRDRQVVSLPYENYAIGGITQRMYHMHVLRAPHPEGEWTIINVHLSAFDDGAETRNKQLRAVFDFAQQEFATGNHVVIGGDWNFEFARLDRPNTTEEKYLFWIYPFPTEMTPEGWKIAVDDTTPSVRTNERPYRDNENYTTVIDGFVVSPNVIVESINATDLNFLYTDHQPVMGVFRAARE